jgi:hypothetical protein
MVWIVPEISSFYVGALPCPIFSLEWLGHSLVWGVSFPNCLPLEGTDRIQSFGLSQVAHGTQGKLP